MGWYRFTNSGNWIEHSNIYRRTSGTESASLTAVPGRYTDSTRSWRRINSLWRLKSNGIWVKVFSKTTQPYATDGPYINYKGYDQNGGIHVDPWIQMGPDTPTWGSSPSFLWGEDGTWDQATVSRSATFTWNNYEDATSSSIIYETEGTTNDKLANTSSSLGLYDNNYIWYRVRKTNSKGSTGTSFSESAFVTKQEPSGSFILTSPSISQTGTAISAEYSIINLWYKSPDVYDTTIEWFADASASATLSASNRVAGPYSIYTTSVTTDSSSTYAGTDTFTPSPTHVGKYIYSRLTIRNSYTDFSVPTPIVIDVRTTNTVSSAPIAPATLSATTNRTDGVFLQWQNTGANYYEIYWQSTQGGGPVNQSTYADFGQDNSITTTSFLDITIPSGTTRYYRVRSRNDSSSNGTNCSNWYPTYGVNAITGTRLAITPAIPTGLDGYANGNGSLQTFTLSWNAALNANNYELFFNSSNSTPTDSNTPDYGVSPLITATTYTTPSIFLASTTYYWWVRSVSSSNTRSGWSPVKILTTNSAAPGVPTSLSATTTRSDGVNLTFSGSSGATGYDIFWNTTVGGRPSNTATPDFPNKQSPFLDDLIGVGVTRYYWVRGYNSSGVSDWYPLSNGVTGTRVAATVAPYNGSVSVSPSSGTAGSTVFTATPSGWLGTPSTFTYTYSWQYLNISGSIYWQQFATGSTAVAPNITNAGAWQVVLTVSNGVSPNGIASDSFSVSAPVSNLTAPSIYNVIKSGSSYLVYFTGGSGPYYQVWWQGSSGTPTTTGYDFSGSSSPISVTNLTASAGSTYYFSARSVSSPGNTGSGPSSTISSWSGQYAYTAPSAAPATAPGTPGTPTNGWTGGTAYPFSWSAPSAGTVSGGGAASISYYNLYVYQATNSSGSGSTLVNTYTVYGTSFNYTSPNALLYYACAVSAVNTAGLTGGISGISAYR